MKEHSELIGLVQEPPQRRCWLLHEALRCVPLDRAIELARNAEAFVTGSPVVNRPAAARASATKAVIAAPVSAEQVLDAEARELSRIASRPAGNKSGLALSPDQRDQLLERLARGARNAELAKEFGLSSKQVQGIRMGSARDIAKRRDGQSQTTASPAEISHPPASAEDIVRYLRQQDDIVVPDRDGAYLVNGRFQLGLAELVERANKMRRRQAKAEFVLAGNAAVRVRNVIAANGHLMFWKEPASARSRSEADT